MRVWMLLTALVCASACTREPTEIFLVVRSNFHDYEIDAIRVRVMYLENDPRALPPPQPSPFQIPPLDFYQPDDPVRVEQYEYQYRWTHEFAVQNHGDLPLEIGVAPHEHDASRTAYFEAFAMNHGVLVGRTAARTHFVAHRSVRLTLWLTADCSGVTCPMMDQVCEFGGCIDVGDRERCLVGTSDDAGVLRCPAPPTACQAWVPCPGAGGCILASRPDGAACDDGDPCTDSTCTAGACVATPSSGAECDDGEPCTHHDTCNVGVCAGTPISCVSDACADRACNGTDTCTAIHHGTPIYEHYDLGWDYGYEPMGDPVFYALNADKPLYIVEAPLGDKALDTDPNWSNTCWCGNCTCQYHWTGRMITVASVQATGMSELMRCVAAYGAPPSPDGDLQHRAMLGCAPPFINTIEGYLGHAYVCPP